MRSRAATGKARVLGRRAPPDRQGHPALPRRLLAGDAVERGSAAAQAGLLPRLPDRERAEDLEVAAGHEGRPERDRRRAGRSIRCATSCCASTRSARDGDFTLRGAVPALRVRPRQRPRQPAQPHDLDGAQVRRAGRSTRSRRRSVTADGGLGRRSRRPKRRGRNSPRRARWRRPGRWSARGTATSTKRSPGRCAKDGNTADAADGVLATRCETLRWAALMVAPAMPVAAREILRQLGRENDEGTWPDEVGLAGRNAGRSRSRCSRASSPNARRR